MEKDPELCIHKKEVSKLLNMVSSLEFHNKIQTLKHLKTDPLYQCYFCDGYNYNCEAYKCK